MSLRVLRAYLVFLEQERGPDFECIQIDNAELFNYWVVLFALSGRY